MLSDWKAISSRIDALRESALFYAQMTASNSNDSYGAANVLLYEAHAIFKAISEFARTFEHRLPLVVKQALSAFLKTHSDKFREKNEGGFNTRELLMTGIAALSATNGQVNFGLADTQASIRRRSERAFIHLQRSIHADPKMREAWKNAFVKNEPDCEKLGALHLLWHGIWAFKADATGGRTDLLFGEPVDNSDIDRSADGLVLTEWKLARAASGISRAFAAAKLQADRYHAGILAGLELRDYRYLVVVSEQGGGELPDTIEGSVTYRHISLAVDPLAPSKPRKK